MNKEYSNEIIWKQIQEYLPQENRLNENNMPKEEWMEIGKSKVHIDHYSSGNEKGVIIIYHGVGGNGRLL